MQLGQAQERANARALRAIIWARLGSFGLVRARVLACAQMRRCWSAGGRGLAVSFSFGDFRAGGCSRVVRARACSVSARARPARPRAAAAVRRRRAPAVSRRKVGARSAAAKKQATPATQKEATRGRLAKPQRARFQRPTVGPRATNVPRFRLAQATCCAALCSLDERVWLFRGEPINYSVGTRGNTGWYAYGAEDPPGASTGASTPGVGSNVFAIDKTTIGPCNSGGALKVSSTGNDGSAGWGVGFGVNMMPTVAGVSGKAKYDAKAAGYTGIGFFMKCQAETDFGYVKIVDAANDADVASPVCSYATGSSVICNQYGQKNESFTTDWSYYKVHFGETLQDWDGNGTITSSGLNASALTAFQIQMNTKYTRDGSARVKNGFTAWPTPIRSSRPSSATPTRKLPAARLLATPIFTTASSATSKARTSAGPPGPGTSTAASPIRRRPAASRKSSPAIAAPRTPQERSSRQPSRTEGEFCACRPSSAWATGDCHLPQRQREMERAT